MSNLTMAQAKAVGADLAQEYRLTIVESDSPLVKVTVTALKVLLALIPVVGPLAIVAITKAEENFGRVSVTLPLPWGGSLVILSDYATDTPEDYLCTVTHEAGHGKHTLDIGGWQAAVDYLASVEMRAAAEAMPYALGLWVRYLLTGVVPDASGPHASLASNTYHLPVEHQHLAHDQIESNLATIRNGLPPPIATAVFVLASMRRHCPAAIDPQQHR